MDRPGLTSLEMRLSPPSCKCSRRGTTREYRRVLIYLCTAQNRFRTRIGAGCAARLFLELLSTECPSVLFTSSGWMLLPCGYVMGVHGALVAGIPGLKSET